MLALYRPPPKKLSKPPKLATLIRHDIIDSEFHEKLGIPIGLGWGYRLTDDMENVLLRQTIAARIDHSSGVWCGHDLLLSLILAVLDKGCGYRFLGMAHSCKGREADTEHPSRSVAGSGKLSSIKIYKYYSSTCNKLAKPVFFFLFSQEMSFPEQQIQPIDALSDMSHGQWEGCQRSDMYTPEILSLIERLQPDFSAPSGESLRQVEFRMVEFLNRTLLVLPEKLKSDFCSPRPNNIGFSQPNSIHDRDGSSCPALQWDILHRHRQLSRKKSGKSRLQVVTTTGDHYPEDEMSTKEPSSSHQSSISEINVPGPSGGSSCIGVFTHSMPIRCLLTGILGCSPVMSHKLCIEDSSVTVLQHSWKTGWQIKRLNETAHLRLL
ncbi:hypothetical protein Cgig2_000977 [Carnegiea gigantea]|uniref:Uncharacterized protein n=1 Tax=Carnegiea gigantea TaxID=171969 RepID=A0A9Q1K444_9CARY|nr:hypothetical protein Cgig2_000977 [Carnegiea gigantea]